MAIEAKATFLSELERTFSPVMTAEMMEKALSMISDTLNRYSLDVIEEPCSDKDDLFNAYVDAMAVQGRSEKTIERYRYIIQRLMASVKVPTREITVYHLRRYLSEEKERGIADRTLESTRQVFSAYFNWLHREGLISKNPVANLGAIKCAKKVKDIYSDVDLEKLKLGCESIRDRAIVAFLLSTGCRISEMTQLNRDDVNLSTLECKVLGKGNKERIVYLSSVAAMQIKAYLDTRTDNLEALFVGKGTERIHPGGVRLMLNKLADKTGTFHVHPHKFRRTLATNLIRHGMPIQEVASILGHDKLDTTMQYVVLDQTETKHAYRKYA